MSPTATENSERLAPNAPPSRSWIRNSPLRRGEANAMTVSGETGQVASRPDSGSRMIDEAKVVNKKLGDCLLRPV